jgi:hypothetical protein
MVALPIASAIAKPPTTVISGTLTMIGNPLDYEEVRYLGNSGMWISTFTNSPLTITGDDIEGEGVWNGVWVVKPIPDSIPPVEIVAGNGWYIIDADVNGDSGTLTIRLPGNGKIIVVDGTGGLENLRGTGTMTMARNMMTYTFTLNAHWDP